MTEAHTLLAAQFRAGRTRRWHANAWLADTNDRVDGHAARVARIILALHPAPTLALVAAALVHDDGENGETGIGDIPGPVKDGLPADLRAALDLREGAALAGLWPVINNWLLDALTLVDQDWLRFADRLDRLIWAAWHRPALLQREDWLAQLTQAEGDAVLLGVDLSVRQLLAEVAQ